MFCKGKQTWHLFILFYTLYRHICRGDAGKSQMLVHQREPGKLVMQGSDRALLARSAPHRREKKHQDTKEKGECLTPVWLGYLTAPDLLLSSVYACICTHMCLFIWSPKVDSRIMLACSPPCMPRQELSTEPRPCNRASLVSKLPLGIPISVFPG